jgi:hypothetical protein
VSARRPPASARVQAEWARRVGVEYTSAAVTQQLTLWLIQIGASPDLIRTGLRIVGDELEHAEAADRVRKAARGEAAPIDRGTLGIARDGASPIEHDVVRVCLGTFCLGETIAVPLFRALRDPCTVPIARQALDRVLRDEVRHRDFGWALLAWMFERDDTLRTLVEHILPAHFTRLRATYAPPGASSRSDWNDCTPAERAWGIMPLIEYEAALGKTLERDFLPRFGKLGLDAGRAWR